MKTKNEENPALEPLNQSKSRGKRASQDSRIEPCFYPIQSATLSEIMQLKPSMQVKKKKKLRRIGDTQTEAIALSTVKSELAVVVLFSARGQRVDPHRNHRS